MFKLALLVFSLWCSLIGMSVARPGFLHHDHHLDHHHLDYPLLHHHEPLHVAKVVHVPAAVSHQSSTVIHTVPHHVIKPIVVPVVKTIVHPPPIIKTIHPVPIIKAYHPEPLHFEPHHFDAHHHFDEHHPFDHHHFH